MAAIDDFIELHINDLTKLKDNLIKRRLELSKEKATIDEQIEIIEDKLKVYKLRRQSSNLFCIEDLCHHVQHLRYYLFSTESKRESFLSRTTLDKNNLKLREIAVDKFNDYCLKNVDEYVSAYMIDYS